MYYSADKRFIIKQINKNEVNRMLKMLDEYIQHLEDSRDGDGPPHSLLQRVVQCNRITMSEHDKCCGVRPGRLYFMVMENCFYPRIIRQIAILHKEENPGQPPLSDEATEQLPLKEKAPLLRKLELNDYTNQCFFVYDLKGSRHGRSALMDNNGTREQQMRSTMKDNDLRENVHLSAGDRKVVLDFLEKDSKFLADQQVMDYSLLLGIQKGVQPVPARTFSNSAGPVAAANKFQQFAPAAALDGAEIFYFGIIDFLQEWNGWKQAEAKTKALVYGWDDISAVKPDLYQKRFVYRLGQYFPATEPEPEQEVAPLPNGVSRPASPLRANHGLTGAE